jgi:hypothetical protein
MRYTTTFYASQSIEDVKAFFFDKHFLRVKSIEPKSGRLPDLVSCSTLLSEFRDCESKPQKEFRLILEGGHHLVTFVNRSGDTKEYEMAYGVSVQRAQDGLPDNWRRSEMAICTDTAVLENSQLLNARHSCFYVVEREALLTVALLLPGNDPFRLSVPSLATVDTLCSTLRDQKNCLFDIFHGSVKLAAPTLLCSVLFKDKNYVFECEPHVKRYFFQSVDTQFEMLLAGDMTICEIADSIEKHFCLKQGTVQLSCQKLQLSDKHTRLDAIRKKIIGPFRFSEGIRTQKLLFRCDEENPHTVELELPLTATVADLRERLRDNHRVPFVSTCMFSISGESGELMIFQTNEGAVIMAPISVDPITLRKAPVLARESSFPS